MDNTTNITPKPEWLRVRLDTNKNYREMKDLIHGANLHTVCEEARCPNLHECWARHRTATFMILGEVCTRNCRFCSVCAGIPAPVDLEEPMRIAESVKKMQLRHAVVTMVTRDDLADGGAGALAETVRAIRRLNPDCSVEVLSSDFRGNRDALTVVLESRPDIMSHNIETVRRLSLSIRSKSSYDRSLEVLAASAAVAPDIKVKSSIMLGLGEERAEVLEAMDDLRAAGVSIINIGQYLQPSRSSIPVTRYWTPEEFADLKAAALEKGFLACDSGPLVRSSYHAGDQYAGI